MMKNLSPYALKINESLMLFDYAVAMASVGAGTRELPPFRHKKLWRLSLAVCFVSLLASCGAFDYSVGNQNFRSERYRERTLGNLYFTYDEKSEPYEMNLKRVHKGYAVHAPVYESDNDKTHAHFTVSRTRDYKWFSGVQLTFEF